MRLAHALCVFAAQLGVQTYSFRDLARQPGGDAVDTVIKAVTECGLGECELFAPQVEPQAPPGGRGPGSPEALKAREDLRKWRVETPLEHFQDIRRRFGAAGISIYAYNYSFNASFTDQEIDRGFEMTRALGAGIITASTTLDSRTRNRREAGVDNRSSRAIMSVTEGRSQCRTPSHAGP
jgi:hypothetical protein